MFVSENKTAEAAQVREESVQVMQAIDVQEKGRLREQAAPVDLSVHVCGIVFGLAYVLLLKPKQRDRGFREYSSFAKSTLELFSRLVGSRNKKRRAQKQ